MSEERRIYEVGKDTRELFRVEITDEGAYFAVRTESPCFMMFGNTIAEAVQKAESALALMQP